VGYLPYSNEVSVEAEESTLLEAITRERMVKTQQTEKTLCVLFQFVKCGDRQWRYN
jgi:hypothetical protein